MDSRQDAKADVVKSRLVDDEAGEGDAEDDAENAAAEDVDQEEEAVIMEEDAGEAEDEEIVAVEPTITIQVRAH